MMHNPGTEGRVQLAVVEEGGMRIVEGPPGEPVMTGVDDARVVVEACVSAATDKALLHPHNLTGAFFDLSSGEAGAILQRLRNYRVRLAIVCPAGSVRFSRRFGEVLAEERAGPYFRVFETRAEACRWLGRAAEPGGD
jgi:hypothetical protein